MPSLAIIGAILLIKGIQYLVIGYLAKLLPRYLETEVGTLKNVRTYNAARTLFGIQLPVFKKYTYSYMVDGKIHESDTISRRPEDFFRDKATIVYLKWFPGHGYHQAFNFTAQTHVGFALVCVALLLIRAA